MQTQFDQKLCKHNLIKNYANTIIMQRVKVMTKFLQATEKKEKAKEKLKYRINIQIQ